MDASRQRHVIGKKPIYRRVGPKFGEPGYNPLKDADDIAAASSAVPGLALGALGMAALIVSVVAVFLAGFGYYTYNPNPVFDSIQIKGNATVIGHLNFSLATVTNAPMYIVVGSGTPGVEDWPTSQINTRKRTEHALKNPRKNPHVDLTLRKRAAEAQHAKNPHSKKMSQTIPIAPSRFETVPLPPPGAIYVSTIAQAMAILHGKTITNTTIFLRAQNYPENVVLDGFKSNCDGSYSSSPENNQGPSECRGLNFVGDARLIAGYTYMHGTVSNMDNNIGTLFGSDGGTVNLTCLTSSSINVTQPPDPFWSTFDVVPDFNLLLLVPGDKIVLFDAATRLPSEKTVTSVSGNTISFTPAGCALNGKGSSLTFLPNRQIIGQAPTLITPEEPTPDEVFATVPAVLNVQEQANLVGIHVTFPDGDPYGKNIAIVCRFAESVHLDGVVCDARKDTSPFVEPYPTAVSFFGGSDLGYGGPNFNQEVQNEIGFNATLTNPFGPDAAAKNSKQTMTVLGGTAYFESNVYFETVHIIGGNYFSVGFSRTAIATLNIITKADNQGNFFNEQSSTFVEILNIFAWNSRGIRCRWLGKLIVSRSVGYIRAGGANSACISALDSSRVEFYDALELGNAIPSFVFTFQDCPGRRYEVLNHATIHLALPPNLINVSTTDVVSDTGFLVVDGSIRPGTLRVSAGDDVNTTTTTFNPRWRTQLLRGTGPRTLNITAAQLADAVNKYYTFTSLTNQSHVLNLFGGATWPGGSATLTFPPKIGATIECFVQSATVLGKCTASWHLPAPKYIVVGQGTPGVEDWPTSVLNLKRYIEHAIKHAPRNENYQDTPARRSVRHAARLTQTIPTAPSRFETIPLPPVGSVYFNTIEEALKELHGMVVTNTTIFLRAGDYPENVVLDGFISNCDGTQSNSILNNQGPTECRGLNFVGDARLIAGYTYMHGVVSNFMGEEGPLFGSDGGLANLVCLNTTAISVTRPAEGTWSLYNTQPNFNTLLLVPGDKIVLMDAATRVVSEKNVTAVNGNQISFSPAGCDLNGKGSTLTFLPNRRISGNAPLLVTPGTQTAEEAFAQVPAVFNVQTDVNIVGIHVTHPSGPGWGVNIGTACIISGSVFLDGVVCDTRANTTVSRDGLGDPIAMEFSAPYNSIGGSANFNQDVSDEFGFNASLPFGGGAPIRHYQSSSFTVIGGNLNMGASTFNRAINIISGSIFVLLNSKVNVITLNVITPANGAGNFFNEASDTTVDILNSFAWNSRGVRTRWGGELTISNALGNVRAGSTTRPCISVVDSSRVQIMDPVGVAQFSPNFVFNLIDCPGLRYEIVDHGSLYIVRAPVLTNVSTIDSISDVGQLTIDGSLRPGSSIVTASAPFNHRWRIQRFSGSGPNAMTLSSTILADMINKNYQVQSLTTDTHSITLCGGATWNSAGSTIAIWNGTLGTGLHFSVLSSTFLYITNNRDVIFSRLPGPIVYNTAVNPPACPPAVAATAAPCFTTLSAAHLAHDLNAPTSSTIFVDMIALSGDSYVINVTGTGGASLRRLDNIKWNVTNPTTHIWADLATGNRIEFTSSSCGTVVTLTYFDGVYAPAPMTQPRGVGGSSGNINSEFRLQQLIRANNGLQTLSLPASQLANMIGFTYRIECTTIAASTITLSGGAVWSPGNTKATCAGIGTFVEFTVVSSTVIASVTGTVTFSP